MALTANGWNSSCFMDIGYITLIVIVLNDKITIIVNL